jgi:hypothetical protein
MSYQAPQPHVIVFAKFPLPGRVKTRLAAGTNTNFATGLYSCFVQDIFTQLSTLTVSLELSLGFEHDQSEISAWIPQKKIITFQSGATLGDRMSNAFRNAFSKGCERVILIGSDAPDLPITIYNEAIHSLRSSDMCLGPSEDGGYYLIGFNRKSFTDMIFKYINWSTPTVLEESKSRINSTGLSCAFLHPWNDNDELDDVISLYSRLKETPETCPISLAFLQDHLHHLPNHLDPS